MLVVLDENVNNAMSQIGVNLTSRFDALTGLLDLVKGYNEHEYKTIARHEVKLNLDDLFKISRKLLKNNGSIAIVHRAERLIDIIEKMRKNNIEPKRIQFVYPHIDSESNIVLVEGTKNGKPGIKILKPIYAHNNDGSYSSEIKSIFGK